MFSVVDPDYTAFVWYVIVVSVVAVFVVICALIRYEVKKMARKMKGEPEPIGWTLNQILTRLILLLSAVFATIFGSSVHLDAEQEAYNSNAISVQETLNDKYSGDFVVYTYYSSYRPHIDFSHLDAVEHRNVKVERKIDGVVYVYRLVFDDEGQPDVIRVVSSDSVEYPSLNK